MDNVELDRRLKRALRVVRTLVDDLRSEDPTIERGVVLGALLGCCATLQAVSYDEPVIKLSVVLVDEGTDG